MSKETDTLKHTIPPVLCAVLGGPGSPTYRLPDTDSAHSVFLETSTTITQLTHMWYDMTYAVLNGTC
jgi:hypothetical protein